MTSNMEWQRQRVREILIGEGAHPDDIPDDLEMAVNHVTDLVFSRGDTLTICDLAQVAGLDRERVIDNFHHLGISAPTADSVLFNDRDIALVQFLESATNDTLTEAEGIEVLHVAGTALAATAEAGVAGHVQGPETRTRSPVEHLELNLAMSAVGLELGQHLATAFRHHLRQAAPRQRRTQSVQYREVVEMAVGFVDLVGFTSLSHELEPGQLVDLIRRFEAQAHELAHDLDARVVKLVGDEVMFVAERSADAAAFALGMMHTYSDRHVMPRGGIAMGDLVSLHGDYFGPVVNLAARLVAAAVPGEVLVDDSITQIHNVVTEPAGRRMLKGFVDPVKVHSLLNTNAPTAEPVAIQSRRSV